MTQRKGPRLLRRLCLGAVCLWAACVFSGDAAANAADFAGKVQATRAALARTLPRSAAVDKVRLTWPLVPGASYYHVVLLFDTEEYKADKVIYGETVSAPGAEINLGVLRGAQFDKTYWAVVGVRANGAPVGAYSTPRPLSSGERRPTSPLIASDYASMAEMPIYPVYAWIPVQGTSSYEVEVWRAAGEKKERVRHYYTYETILYDETPIRQAGEYEWHVRALDGNGRKWSDWSEPERFTVRAPVTVAALGDSITHGGGAIMAPPSRSIYCWETYAGLPVKNLGRSGDTTAELLDRFENDVPPFAPKYLVIMGGVNDFRVGTSARVTIANLSRLAEKCRAHGITPIFATATPICPRLMAKVWEIESASSAWRAEQRAVNAWIMAQPHAVDVATPLTDENGELKESLTTDGLHPDAEAKKIIGERIGTYLREKFGLKKE